MQNSPLPISLAQPVPCQLLQALRCTQDLSQEALQIRAQPPRSEAKGWNRKTHLENGVGSSEVSRFNGKQEKEEQVGVRRAAVPGRKSAGSGCFP